MSLGRVVLAPPERRELKRRARQRSLAVEIVKRAEVILMLASGHSYREVRERLDCSDEYIREWKKRFQEERLAGLDSRYRGSQPRTRTAEGEARILEVTRQGPADGTTHWSSYRLAKNSALASPASVASGAISRRSSVSMKRALSKHSTDLTRFCRSPPGEPSGMGLSIFVMARSHCMPHLILAPATSSVRPPTGIPASNLSTF